MLLCFKSSGTDAVRKTRILPLLLLILILSGCCYYRYERASMNTYLPNASQARTNAQSGLRNLQAGYTDLAQEQLELAAQQNPKDPAVLDALAYFYEKTGQIDKANQYYMQALLLGPNTYEANALYGAFLCRNGYYAESIQYFRKAAHNPNRDLATRSFNDGHYCAEEMQRALGDKRIWAYYMQQDKP
jgi:type IV pilus assembly protein PilF